MIDQCYDQGYGSERSPEDEMPPPLPILGVEHQYNPMVANAIMMPQGYLDGMSHMDPHQRLHQQVIQQNYDFITEGKPYKASYYPDNIKALKKEENIFLRNSGKLDQKSFNFHHPST